MFAVIPSRFVAMKIGPLIKKSSSYSEVCYAVYCLPKTRVQGIRIDGVSPIR